MVAGGTTLDDDTEVTEHWTGVLWLLLAWQEFSVGTEFDALVLKQALKV